MAKSMRASKEIDTWFDQSKADIAVSSEFSEKCIKAAQRLCYARISLAESCRDLARKLSDFGDFDTQLSSVRHFAVNFEKTSTGLEKQTQAMDRSLINGLRLVSVHCDSAEVSVESQLNLLMISNIIYFNIVDCTGRSL
jgi:hypothetical protein